MQDGLVTGALGDSSGRGPVADVPGFADAAAYYARWATGGSDDEHEYELSSGEATPRPAALSVATLPSPRTAARLEGGRGLH